MLSDLIAAMECKATSVFSKNQEDLRCDQAAIKRRSFGLAAHHYDANRRANGVIGRKSCNCHRCRWRSGRAHALLLAEHGACVVVNDLGGARDGTGSSNNMADSVVEEIRAAGGQAATTYGSVTDDDAARAMVQCAVDSFGRLDILINNAGILRDDPLKT